MGITSHHSVTHPPHCLLVIALPCQVRVHVRLYARCVKVLVVERYRPAVAVDYELVEIPRDVFAWTHTAAAALLCWQVALEVPA